MENKIGKLIILDLTIYPGLNQSVIVVSSEKHANAFFIYKNDIIKFINQNGGSPCAKNKATERIIKTTKSLSTQDSIGIRITICSNNVLPPSVRLKLTIAKGSYY